MQKREKRKQEREECVMVKPMRSDCVRNDDDEKAHTPWKPVTMRMLSCSTKVMMKWQRSRSHILMLDDGDRISDTDEVISHRQT